MEIPSGLTMLRYRMYSSAIYILLSELSDTINMSAKRKRVATILSASSDTKPVSVKRSRKAAQFQPGVNLPGDVNMLENPGGAAAQEEFQELLVNEPKDSVVRMYRVTKPDKCVVQSLYCLDLFCNIPQFIPRYGFRLLPISEEACEEAFNQSNEAGAILRSKVQLGLQDKKVRYRRLFAKFDLQNNGKRSTIPRIKHSMFPDIVFAPCVVRATDETVADRFHMPKNDPLRKHTVVQRSTLRSSNHLRRQLLLIEDPLETGKSVSTNPAAENTDVEMYADNTVIARLHDPLQKIATSSNLVEADTMVICICGLHSNLSNRVSQLHLAEASFIRGPSRFEYFYSAICVVLSNYLLEHPASGNNHFSRLKLYFWAYLCTVASPTAHLLFEHGSSLRALLRSNHVCMNASSSITTSVVCTHSNVQQINAEVLNVMDTPLGGDASMNIPSVAKLSTLKQRLESLHTHHTPAQPAHRNNHIITSSSTSHLPTISLSAQVPQVPSGVFRFRYVPPIVANAFTSMKSSSLSSFDNSPSFDSNVVQPHPLQLLFRFTDYRDKFPNCTWNSFLGTLDVEEPEPVPGAKAPPIPSFVSPAHMSLKPAHHVTGFWSWAEWNHLRKISMLQWWRYYTRMPMISHMNRFIAQERIKKIIKKRIHYDSLNRLSPHVMLMREQLNDRMIFYADNYANMTTVASLTLKRVIIPPALQTLIDIDLNPNTILGFHVPVSVDPFRCHYPEHKNLKFRNEELLDHHLLIYHHINAADDPVVTADDLYIQLALDDVTTDEFECDFEDD